ncbi:MAG TPA: hypothetical protein ENH82_08280 [bacterium]|nr:hypothetical protein [bacterium]
MNTDDIKWCIEKAEGFVLEAGVVFYSFNDSWNQGRLLEAVETWEHFPHLLTRTIEGINREEIKEFDILQDFSSIQIFKMGILIKAFGFVKYGSIDEAKQAAIDYVIKQEKTS